MRAVIQRVKYAHVIIDREEKRTSGPGLMVLLGIGHYDNQEDVQWLANKILNLRIFNDVKGIMNQSIKEIKGEIMVISQFTLMAQTKKGNRPSYDNAAKHEHAIPLYNLFKTITQNGVYDFYGRLHAGSRLHYLHSAIIWTFAGNLDIMYVAFF